MFFWQLSMIFWTSQNLMRGTLRWSQGNSTSIVFRNSVELFITQAASKGIYLDVINTGIGVSGDRTAQILKISNKQIVEQPANSVELGLASRFRANLRGSWMAIS